MQITRAPLNPIDLLMPNELRRAELSLPATAQAARRATLEGLLIQEANGADVGARILAVCKEMDC
jgi:hypothetical protein